MAHKITILPEQYAVIELDVRYRNFGQAREIVLTIYVWPKCEHDDISSSVLVLPDYPHPDMSRRALAKSHVWYRRLRKQLAEGMTLLNQGSPESWYLLDSE